MELTQDIKNTLQEYYGTLPSALQYALISDEIKEMLGDLSQKYNLSEEEDVTLSNEVLFVLLGFSKKEDFNNNLTSEGVSQEKAGPLSNEVRTLIFEPLNEEFRELFKEETVSSHHKPELQKTPSQTPQIAAQENKDDILHDIEEPKSFEVPFHKTVFEEKLSQQVPETKEEMLEALKNPDMGSFQPSQKHIAPPENLPTDIQNTKPSHDLFPQPKKESTNRGAGDPYREPIE